MRSIYFTYVNNGSTFAFWIDQYTRHPYKNRKTNMLQVHALLTQEAHEDGKHETKLLDQHGTPLTEEQINFAAANGKIMGKEAA